MPRVLPSAYKKRIFRIFVWFFFGKRIFEFLKFVCRQFCRRRSTLLRGPGYADGNSGSTEGGCCRGAMRRAALSVAYADDQNRLRRGFLAIGISAHSSSGSFSFASCADELFRFWSCGCGLVGRWGSRPVGYWLISYYLIPSTGAWIRTRAEAVLLLESPAGCFGAERTWIFHFYFFGCVQVCFFLCE
jgi:hypothetical protein